MARSRARRCGASAGSWIAGLIAGVVGAVIGTSRRRRNSLAYGECVRARHAGGFHRGRRRDHPRLDYHQARSDEPPFRRHRDRRRAGRTADGRPDRRDRKDRRPHRAQAHRRNLRQHRLHADQGDGRERLCRASCKARRGFRRDRRNCGRRFRGGDGPQERNRRQLALTPRGLAQRPSPLHRHRRPSALPVADHSSGSATTRSRPNSSSSTSAAAPRRPISPAAIRSRRSTTRRCSNWTPCLNASSSLEEATSDSSSPKYSGASAPR